MLIDWFTVIAQAVNFLILAWLLKRFLYAPILKALDARETRIAGELADAEVKKAEAERERDAFRLKNEEFDRQQTTLWAEATQHARSERQRLIEDARQEAEDLRVRRMESLSNDYRNVKEEIVRRTRHEVFAIARKTLGDLAAANLEGLMVEVFIRRCNALEEEEKNALQSAFETSAGPALVRSTFPLPEEQKRAVELISQEVFHSAGHLQFETSPDLISGIELSMDGHEVSWSIADYLLVLEKNVGDLLFVDSPDSRQNESPPNETGPDARNWLKRENGVD